MSLEPCLEFSRCLVKSRSKGKYVVDRSNHENEERLIKLVGEKMQLTNISKTIKKIISWQQKT